MPAQVQETAQRERLEQVNQKRKDNGALHNRMKKILITFKCKGCKKTVTRRIYANIAQLVRYCNDCKDGRHWRRTHRKYARKYWKEYKKTYFCRKSMLWPCCKDCNPKERMKEMENASIER